MKRTPFTKTPLAAFIGALFLTASVPVLGAQAESGDQSSQSATQSSTQGQSAEMAKSGNEAKFKEIDKDGNRSLSLEEAKAAMSEDEFNQADKDGNGELSHQEFNMVMKPAEQAQQKASGAMADEQSTDDETSQQAAAEGEDAMDQAEEETEQAAAEGEEAMDQAAEETEQAAAEGEEAMGEVAEETEQAADEVAEETEQAVDEAAEETQQAAAEGEEAIDEAADETEQAATEGGETMDEETEKPEAQQEAPQVAVGMEGMTVEELLGREVINSSTDEEIGEIEEIVADQSNKLHAVVSVGGFLGIGDKDIAVPLSELEVTDEAVLMMTNRTADELKEQANAYDESQYQRLQGDQVIGELASVETEQ